MKKVIFKLSKIEPVCIFKEGWCVGLGQEGGSLCETGGNCLKYLKRGWSRKEGGGNKHLKKRGQAGLRGGYLKKGGGWNPLTNYK